MRTAVDTSVLIPLLRGKPENQAQQAAKALIWYDQADFLIGAHALHRADILLSADAGIPPKYFPALRLVNPFNA